MRTRMALVGGTAVALAFAVAMARGRATRPAPAAAPQEATAIEEQLNPPREEPVATTPPPAAKAPSAPAPRPVVAKTVAPPPPVATTLLPEGPTDRSTFLRDLADETCQCTDAACARSVSHYYASHVDQIHSDGRNEDTLAETKRASQCLSALLERPD